MRRSGGPVSNSKPTHLLQQPYHLRQGYPDNIDQQQQLSVRSGPSSTEGAGQMSHIGWMSTDSGSVRLEHVPDVAPSTTAVHEPPPSMVSEPQAEASFDASLLDTALPSSALVAPTSLQLDNVSCDACPSFGLQPDVNGTGDLLADSEGPWAIGCLDGLEDLVEGPGDACDFEDILLQTGVHSLHSNGADLLQPSSHLGNVADESRPEFDLSRGSADLLSPPMKASTCDGSVAALPGAVPSKPHQLPRTNGC